MNIINIVVLNLIFIASAYSNSSSLTLPVKDQQLNKLPYHVENEWNLIPDSAGGWRMIHISELIDSNKYETLFEPETDVHFILYTKSNTIGVRILLENLESLISSGFDRNLPVRFVIHGFQNTLESEINQVIPKAYREKGLFNTIVVDWSLGGNLEQIYYFIARYRVPSVAKIVARFIDFLVLKGGSKTQKITIVGHSLGAHVAGITGKNVKSGRIQTIFGLDPAWPLFFQFATNQRINKGDAEYVEIIHTNCGRKGIGYSTGDVDFYPNGVTAQPGCDDYLSVCAHARAYQYFAESITSDFFAIPCNIDRINSENCDYSGTPIKMGGEPSNYGKGYSGDYYLTTNVESPFSKGYPEPNITIKDVTDVTAELCIRAIKKQIQMKFKASIIYLAMGAYFLRDTINLPGFTKKFIKYANEERDHVIILISYLLMDGELNGQMKSKININVTDLINIHPVSKKEWSNGFNAFYDASRIEENLSQANKILIHKCESTSVIDDHVLDYLNEYRKQQYHKQREITEIYLILGKMNKGLVGEFLYDKKLLG